VPFLAELQITDEPARWREAGFVVSGDGVCPVGSVRLRITPPGTTADPLGLTAWAFEDRPSGVGLIDGLVTVDAEVGADRVDHPVGATSIDHVVVFTPHIARTIAAVEAFGFPLRRVRDIAPQGKPSQQAFFRLGEVILEVVGPVDPDADAADRLATFWGITFTVTDLDATAALLGPERVTAPKDAVQPGRRIASMRSAAGLALPVAFMTR
jgi:hypothetical protein